MGSWEVDKIGGVAAEAEILCNHNFEPLQLTPQLPYRSTYAMMLNRSAVKPLTTSVKNLLVYTRKQKVSPESSSLSKSIHVKLMKTPPPTPSIADADDSPISSDNIAPEIIFIPVLAHVSTVADDHHIARDHSQKPAQAQDHTIVNRRALLQNGERTSARDLRRLKSRLFLEACSSM